MTKLRDSEAGFTLIELLVALAIFALISVAGVMLLRSGSDTQIAVKKRLEEMALSHRAARARSIRPAYSCLHPRRGKRSRCAIWLCPGRVVQL